MSESPSKTYSRSRNVRLRYGGVSAMWITRAMRDRDFPHPVHFGTKENFWDDAELEAWDAAMIARGCEKPTRAPPQRAKAVTS